MLAVRYLRDVSAVLHLRSLASGTLLQAVRLPGLGSVELSGRRESPVMFFSYNSLTDPGATYMCAPPVPCKGVTRPSSSIYNSLTALGATYMCANLCW